MSVEAGDKVGRKFCGRSSLSAVLWLLGTLRKINSNSMYAFVRLKNTPGLFSVRLSESHFWCGVLLHPNVVTWGERWVRDSKKKVSYHRALFQAVPFRLVLPYLETSYTSDHAASIFMVEGTGYRLMTSRSGCTQQVADINPSRLVGYSQEIFVIFHTICRKISRHVILNRTLSPDVTGHNDRTIPLHPRPMWRIRYTFLSFYLMCLRNLIPHVMQTWFVNRAWGKIFGSSG
jgi:hypothetical protein